MLLQDLLQSLPEVEVPSPSGVEVRDVSYDSRRTEPGHLFVAIRGETVDGNEFIRDAVRRGASAVASEQRIDLPVGVAAIRVAHARRFLARVARVFFGDPAAQLRLAGITGTNGKTTTSYLLHGIFRRAGLRSCVVGTLANVIGDRHEPTRHTTPEAPDLLGFMNRAASEGCTHGAVEVSSHALALQRVFGTRFAVGIFTNLTPEHLDFHGSMESYFAAKRTLFMPEGDNDVGTAVINVDDPYGRRLAAEVRMPALGFGLDAGADIRGFDCRCDFDSTRLRARTPSGVLDLVSPLAGTVNVHNILAAVGAALALGVHPEAIAAGVASLHGVEGRMERIEAGQSFGVIVDYAHTPDALERLLTTVRTLTQGRVLTVFGCGGNRDRLKRPQMGEIAAAASDFVVATSDNPRHEDPAEILRAIEGGLTRGPAPYRLVVDRRQAVREALAMARPGDTVVIAGKGHETQQIVGDRALPFDDRVVARELIRELLWPTGAETGSELHQ